MAAQAAAMCSSACNTVSLILPHVKWGNDRIPWEAEEANSKERSSGGISVSAGVISWWLKKFKSGILNAAVQSRFMS